jgi:hypothetical protein
MEVINRATFAATSVISALRGAETTMLVDRRMAFVWYEIRDAESIGNAAVVPKQTAQEIAVIHDICPLSAPVSRAYIPSIMPMAGPHKQLETESMGVNMDLGCKSNIPARQYMIAAPRIDRAQNSLAYGEPVTQ